MRMWWSIVVCVAAWGCVKSSSVECGGITCPEKTECRTLTAPEEFICATETQIAQCQGKAEAEACEAGWCHDGVCLPITCGNSRLDLTETCDDGNTITGDGSCSGDCTSNEKCGNGLVDPLAVAMGEKVPNEECDDGNFISGDGCSSRCLREALRWQELDPDGPPAMRGMTMAYDATRARLVMFGGEKEENGKKVPVGATFERAGVGWLRATADEEPPARVGCGMYYDPIRRRTVLYGGLVGDDDDPPFGDMWEWDGRDWTYRSPPAVTPPRRARFGFAYDGKRKVAVLFGGISGNVPRSDTWEWDGTTWTENTSATHPPAQYGSVFVYDPKRSVIVMAGGMGATKETWEYDGSWKKIATTTPVEIARSAAAYVPALQGVLVHGGYNTVGDARSAKTFLYTGSTWQDLNTTSPTVARDEAVMIALPETNTVVMYGGLTGPSTGPILYVGDVWIFDTQTRTWTQDRNSGGGPPALTSMGTAYDPNTHTGWMFGGLDTNSDETDELWAFDGEVWLSYTTSGPSPRSAARLAYDSSRNELVMFGGRDAQNTLSTPETWVFKDFDWTNVASGSPTARSFHTMGYDPRLKKLILQGGDTVTPDAATWTWNGSSWTSSSSTPNPGSRLVSSMIYDYASESLLLTSGVSVGAPSFLSDLWSYNGTSWSQVASQLPFEDRGLAGLAYVGARKSVMMFGGLTSGGSAFSDVWELRDGAWTRLDVGVGPTPRAGHAVFPSKNGDGIVVFSGTNRLESVTLATPDVWQLESTSATPREICTDEKVDNDGDGLTGCADLDCWASCSPFCPPATSCDMTLPRCGDGTCTTARESCRSCSSDCGACPAICGNAYCDNGETGASCPGDCP